MKTFELLRERLERHRARKTQPLGERQFLEAIRTPERKHLQKSAESSRKAHRFMRREVRVSAHVDPEVWEAPPGLFQESDTLRRRFSTNYQRSIWGNGSGGGSALKPGTAKYIGFLQSFIKQNAVRSIVDVGGGDWQFTRYLDLNGSDYVGIDVVQSVIDRNVESFTRPGVQFAALDILGRYTMPDCDLAICKDVIQHLSDDSALVLISRFRKAKWVVLTNDFAPQNAAIEDGEAHGVNVSAQPFLLPAAPVLTFDRKITMLWDQPRIGSKTPPSQRNLLTVRDSVSFGF